MLYSCFTKAKINYRSKPDIVAREINWNGLNRRINYYYNFDGAKLRKRVENNGTLTKVDYCGPFVYETASGVRSLKYLVTPYGRAVKTGSSWDFEYNLTDHLGNVRAVFRKGSNNLAELIQQKHYYPFGMEISNISLGTGTNKYLYNGKEIQDDFNLYWYDYGARFYDPQLGRWHSVDPLAEKFPFQSSYLAFDGNPINKIDPTGMSADWFQNELTGDIYYNSELRKGAETQLGKAWVHLGENGMFSDGTPMTSDVAILSKNSRLTEKGMTQTLEYDKPQVYADAKVNKIKTEASF